MITCMYSTRDSIQHHLRMQGQSSKWRSREKVVLSTNIEQCYHCTMEMFP